MCVNLRQISAFQKDIYFLRDHVFPFKINTIVLEQQDILRFMSYLPDQLLGGHMPLPPPPLSYGPVSNCVIFITYVQRFLEYVLVLV